MQNILVKLRCLVLILLVDLYMQYKCRHDLHSDKICVRFSAILFARDIFHMENKLNNIFPMHTTYERFAHVS